MDLRDLRNAALPQEVAGLKPVTGQASGPGGGGGGVRVATIDNYQVGLRLRLNSVVTAVAVVPVALLCFDGVHVRAHDGVRALPQCPAGRACRGRPLWARAAVLRG